MKIRIISIGKLKKKFILNSLAEYQKKIRPFNVNLEFIELKEGIGKDKNLIIAQEEKIIESKIDSSSYSFVLSVEGKQFSSEDFADNFQNLMNRGNSKFDFYIGGPYGLTREFEEKFNQKLSLSKMTMPHDLVRLFLTEQIYRAFSILNGTEYHK